VYEYEVDTRDELFQQVFHVAGCVNDASVLRKVTLYIVERVRMCIQGEHLLN
jgi:hypothetical protein